MAVFNLKGKFLLLKLEMIGTIMSKTLRNNHRNAVQVQQQLHEVRRVAAISHWRVERKLK